MYNLSVISILIGILGNSISLHLVPTYLNNWENGIIPIEIKGNFSLQELNVINAAIDNFHQKTCIKFVPLTDQKNYITIVNTPTGCWGLVGQIGGQQMVNLQSPQCTEKIGSIQHELMHAFGFEHVEHDDDDFKIHFKIHDEAVSNPKMAQKEEQEDEDNHEHGHDHDYSNVDGLSEYDSNNINKMYKCNEPTGVQAPFNITA